MPIADLYTFRARVLPTFAVALPLGLLLFAVLPAHQFFVSAFIGVLGTVGAGLAAQVGRDRGFKKQSVLWDGWGGAPTTRLLRHRHIPGDIELSGGLRQQIAEWWGQSLPTEKEEADDPESADARYREATLALIGATYDRSRFPLVFAENVNYGFRRNLWGLRPYGMPIAAGSAVLAWASFSLTVWGRPWPDPWWNVLVSSDSTATIRLVVAAINSALAIFWSVWANPWWVKPVAEAYAKQLMESVRTLRSG